MNHNITPFRARLDAPVVSRPPRPLLRFLQFVAAVSISLTAARAEDLVEASQALLTAAVQGKATGDIVLIEPGDPEPQVSAMVAGSPYATGKRGSYSTLCLLF